MFCGTLQSNSKKYTEKPRAKNSSDKCTGKCVPPEPRCSLQLQELGLCVVNTKMKNTQMEHNENPETDPHSNQTGVFHIKKKKKR